MRDKSRHRGHAALPALALLALTASFASSASAEIPPDAANQPLLQPIDAQNWVDQGELTWAAYQPVPDARPEFYDGSADGSPEPVQDGDHPDRLSRPAVPDHAAGGNASVREPAARLDAGRAGGRQPVDARLLRRAEPVQRRQDPQQLLDGGQPRPHRRRRRRLRPVHDVRASPSSTASRATSTAPSATRRTRPVPPGHTCNRNIRTDGGNAWRAAIGCASGLCGYDNAFYVTAGHDESSTWQEFGEMLWTDREQVPAKFGPPGAEDGPVLNSAGNPIPNWAPTRYVPWTSWRAAANHWPNASGGTSTQAESSGQSVFAHEFSHLRGLPDNYNNPFADNQRAGTGYWEMMSRGTFNGPGGTHNRWQVPNQGGSALGPHHMLALQEPPRRAPARGAAHARAEHARDAGRRGGDDPGARVGAGRATSWPGSRSTSGPAATWPGAARTRAWTRSTARGTRLPQLPRRGRRPGRERLVRPRPRRSCSRRAKNSGTPSVWLIDPNPQDIGMIDFYRPDGTPVAVVRGDPRQLNDATFQAGTRSGSAYEYVDTFNKLHFYVLATAQERRRRSPLRRRRAPDAARAIRSRAASRVGNPTKTGQRPGFLATCTFPLTNTGQAGTGVVRLRTSTGCRRRRAAPTGR